MKTCPTGMRLLVVRDAGSDLDGLSGAGRFEAGQHDFGDMPRVSGVGERRLDALFDAVDPVLMRVDVGPGGGVDRFFDERRVFVDEGTGPIVEEIGRQIGIDEFAFRPVDREVVGAGAVTSSRFRPCRWLRFRNRAGGAAVSSS